jgi:hypothetical protein
VRTTARRLWHLATFYTRFTPAAAISVAEHDTTSPAGYSVIDAAAKLAKDAAKQVGWYFALYVKDTASGNRLVVVVARFGGGPVEEGLYSDGYGFGSQPELLKSVPLNLSDWVRTVAKARGWTPDTCPRVRERLRAPEPRTIKLGHAVSYGAVVAYQMRCPRHRSIALSFRRIATPVRPSDDFPWWSTN